MAQTIGTLLVELQANTTAFARGMTDAKKLSFDSAGSIADSLKRVGGELTKLRFDNLNNASRSLEKIGGVTAGIAVGVATAVTALTVHTAEQVEQMGRLSQSYGLSIETISALRVAAKMTDMDLETLTMGFGKMAKSASQAAKSNDESKTAFGRLNIAVRDTQSGALRPLNDLLLDVADKFSKMQDGTDKTALAMEIFGKSGAGLIPFFNRGKVEIKELLELSDRLGLTWSEKDAASAAKLADAIKLQELQMMALKEQIAKGLLPALDKLATAFLDVDTNGRSAGKALGEGIGWALQKVAEYGHDAYTGIKMVLLASKEAQLMQSHPLQTAKGLLGMDVDSDFAKQLKELDNQIKEVQRANDEFIANLYNPRATPRFGTKTPPPPIIGKGDKSAEDKTWETLDRLNDKTRGLLNTAGADKFATEISNIGAQIQELQKFLAEHPGTFFPDVNRDITELNAALADLQLRQHAAWAEFWGATGKKSMGDVLGSPVATPKVSGEVQAQAEWLKFQQDSNAQNQAAAQIYNDTATASERWAAQLTRLNFLRKEGIVSENTYARAIAQARESVNSLYDQTAKYDQQIRELNDALKSNLLTERSRLEIQRQLRVLEAQRGASRGGARSGIRGGLETVGGQWQGIGNESMQATIDALQNMRSSFHSFFYEVAMGTKGVGQAFAELGTNIVASIMSALAQMLAQWLVTHAAMFIASKIFHKQNNATATVSGGSQATMWANVAAAETLAQVPFPANIPASAAVLGVGMAYAAAAMAAGASGLALAERGWDEVGHDQLAYVHKKEMVLSAPYANVIRSLPKMVSNSRGGEGGKAGVNSGGNSFQFNIDGAGDPKAVADAVMSKVKTMFKSNGVMRG